MAWWSILIIHFTGSTSIVQNFFACMDLYLAPGNLCFDREQVSTFTATFTFGF